MLQQKKDIYFYWKQSKKKKLWNKSKEKYNFFTQTNGKYKKFCV